MARSDQHKPRTTVIASSGPLCQFVRVSRRCMPRPISWQACHQLGWAPTEDSGRWVCVWGPSQVAGRPVRCPTTTVPFKVGGRRSHPCQGLPRKVPTGTWPAFRPVRLQRCLPVDFGMACVTMHHKTLGRKSALPAGGPHPQACATQAGALEKGGTRELGILIGRVSVRQGRRSACVMRRSLTAYTRNKL